jgi:hypothetical protein
MFQLCNFWYQNIKAKCWWNWHLVVRFLLASSQCLILPQLPQKTTLNSKVVKIESKIIISFCKSKFVTHSASVCVIPAKFLLKTCFFHISPVATFCLDVVELIELKSISPTFYEPFLWKYSFANKLHSQTVSREKLCKILLYKKAAPKMLVKLTPCRRGCTWWPSRWNRDRTMLKHKFRECLVSHTWFPMRQFQSDKKFTKLVRRF